MMNETMILLWTEFLQSVLRHESKTTQIIFVVVMFLIFFVSLTGNLLTCIVIYYDKTMHTATNFYLFNLAVSDLIVSFAILLEVQEQLSDAYQFGRIACKLHFFLVVCLWNNSILIMTALAIERYIAIWYPLLLKSTPVWRRVMKIIVLIWIVAIIETLPEVWTVDLIRSQKISICHTVPTRLARILNGILAIVTFLIPLCIMTFVYTMIAFKVNVSLKRNSRDKIFNHRDNRKKVNKLIALTVSFLVCWLPFFSLRVLISAVDMQQLMRSPQWWSVAYRIVMVNSWFSIVLNPLLFSLMSTKFRKALKALWSSRLHKDKSTLHKITMV